MSPCSPNDVSIDLPSGPSGPALPGFGIPFALKLPNLSPFPDGFPEDLLDLLNKLQMLIPPGALKPSLNPNFGKDVFDAIMKLLDQFFPFLMLYKFFLPILKMILCIIEVLCSFSNPFKIIKAMQRLFRNCIPEFLNLFPIFAIIIMIISLLLLLLALIEYIIAQILKFINAILRNINALIKAFHDGDQTSVLAIAKKLGSLLCIFQNLFVLLAIFAIIIQIFQDILSLAFAIPPCDDNNPDGCCTPDVCPTIVKNIYTRSTGTFQYLNEVDTSTTVPGINIVNRKESWQLFDKFQPIPQEFINIVDGYDITTTPKPVFYPTDGVYNAKTAPKQAPYTIDLDLLYNPSFWGRPGLPKNIIFKNCIVTAPPTNTLSLYNNTLFGVPEGVLTLAGGAGFESDGYTKLTGFAADGITPIADQATLENFLHRPTLVSPAPVFSPFDGYTFENMQYTFTPHMDVLLNKNLVTAGCEPDFALDREFVNNVLAGDVAIKTALLNNLVNSKNFPNPALAQECLTTALSGLRGNLTPAGVAQFQATATLCLQKLKDDTNSALENLVTIGLDPCKSNFTLTPNVQFTTQPITVTANLNEKNGLPLTTGIATTVANTLANKLKAHISFGQVSDFTYDGYQVFTANITSNTAGNGQAMVSFDNNIFCTDSIPSDLTSTPKHTLQALNYQFIYAPFTTGATGDTDGKPRRDLGDLSREGGSGNESKDGV